MRVKYCRRCPKYRRRVWSSYYRPRNYHPIGMSHAYAWCLYHEKRCREIRNCSIAIGNQIAMDLMEMDKSANVRAFE